MLSRMMMLIFLLICFTATNAISQEIKETEKKPDKAAPAKSDKPKSDKPKVDPKTPADKADQKVDQKPEKKPEAKPDDKAVADFDKGFGEWKKILIQLKNLSDRHAAASPEERKKIRSEFQALYKKGKAQEIELSKAAEKATLELSDETKDHVRFLIARMTEFVHDQNEKEAIRIGKFLLQQKIKNNDIYYTTAVAAFQMDDYESCIKFLDGTKSDPKDKDVPFRYQARYKEAKARLAEQKNDKLPRVTLKTSKGDVVIELFENEAPNTVANFISLVEKGFYDDSSFHRVLEGFMAQGGSSKGDGVTGPGYRIKSESTNSNDLRPHYRGVISMALKSNRDGTVRKNSGGAQFYITYSQQPKLDADYTVFGRIIKGMENVDKLTRIDPDPKSSLYDPKIVPDKILKATVTRKEKDKKYKPETLPELKR